MDLDVAQELEALLQALRSGLPVTIGAVERFESALCSATASASGWFGAGAAPLTPQQVPPSSIEAFATLALKKDSQHVLKLIALIWSAGGPEVQANIAGQRQVKRWACGRMHGPGLSC